MIKNDIANIAKSITKQNTYMNKEQQDEDITILVESIFNVVEYIKNSSSQTNNSSNKQHLEIKKQHSEGEIKVDERVKDALIQRFLAYINTYEHDSLNTIKDKQSFALKLVRFQLIYNTPHDKLIKCILQCGRDGDEVKDLRTKLMDVVNKYGYT